MTIAAPIALAVETPHFTALVVAVGIGAIILAPVVFFIAALISILASPQSGGMKLVWTIFAFCAPLLGPLLWFLIGRRQARLG